MPGRRHPVGRELEFIKVGNRCCSNIGDGFADRHAAGSRGIDQRQRGLFANGKGLAAISLETSQGHGDIGDRHLPGTDHLIARDQTGYSTIADGNEEGLVGDPGQSQYAMGSLFQIEAGRVECRQFTRLVPDVARHLRRLAKQYGQIHIHRLVAEMAVFNRQVFLFGSMADHGERTALAFTDFSETRHVLLRDCHDIAFLRFVTPEFARRHAKLFIVHVAQLEAGTHPGIVHQLGERIGNTAGADVMNTQNRIMVTELPAAVDHFLRATFELRIAALYRIEIKIFGIGAGIHTGSRTAAEANQHGRTTQLHQRRTRRDRIFSGMFCRDITDAAGQHDGLVIAAHLIGRFDFQRAEITGDIGAAEFVVVGGTAQRAIHHDLQGRGDARGFAVIALPRLPETGNIEIGNGKSGQARLRLGT